MTNNNHNNNYPQYSYEQYQQYYYPQYYSNPGNQPQIPQGDPSAALSSVVYQMQQPSAHTPAYHPHYYHTYPQQQTTDYYADYYAAQDQQRSMLNYGDLAQPAYRRTKPNHQPNPQEPLEKPKVCCNRWLKTVMAVAQHEKLHIQCPSCDHMCLPSVLEEHEEIAHGKVPVNKKPSKPDGVVPANAPKINTPEELEAWITARKKNWPSKANVERKEKEEAEKEARGELSGKKRKMKQNTRQEKKQKTEEINGLVAPYDSEENDEEDDLMDPEKDAITSKDPSAIGKILLPEDKPKRRCKYFMSGKCKRGDECTFLHEKPEPKPKQPRPAPAINRRPNLLFKLLEKDILQEKSVILQCLRYIVDNRFLGNGDKTQKNDDTNCHIEKKEVQSQENEAEQQNIEPQQTNDTGDQAAEISEEAEMNEEAELNEELEMNEEAEATQTNLNCNMQAEQVDNLQENKVDEIQ